MSIVDFYERTQPGVRIEARRKGVVIKQGRTFKTFPMELCVLLAGQKPKVNTHFLIGHSTENFGYVISVPVELKLRLHTTHPPKFWYG